MIRLLLRRLVLTLITKENLKVIVVKFINCMKTELVLWYFLMCLETKQIEQADAVLDDRERILLNKVNFLFVLNLTYPMVDISTIT